MFVTRLISGVVVLILTFGTIYLGGPLLIVGLCAISMIAFRELTRALGVAGRSKYKGTEANEGDVTEKAPVKGFNLLEIVGFIGIAAYYLVTYFFSSDGFEVMELMCIVAVFIAIMAVYVFTFPTYCVEQVADILFSFVYAPVMLSFIYMTRQCPHGHYMVWMIFISAWGCDTCAYVVGNLIGKRRIFPVLSPNKSLAGCIGGVAGTVIIGALYGYFFVLRFFPDQRITIITAFICGCGAIVSQVGDLAASAIKRNHHIKDYGHLIPGHGGIMDRFDSVIVTAPLIYFLAVLMIKF